MKVITDTEWTQREAMLNTSYVSEVVSLFGSVPNPFCSLLFALRGSLRLMSPGGFIRATVRKNEDWLVSLDVVVEEKP